MKKNTMAFVLSLVTVCSMAASQTGCGKITENSAKGTESTRQTTELSSENDKDAVTIDFFIVSAGENPITAGIQDNPVANYIKEQTGVTMNVIVLSNEKMQAMAASGDLYDVCQMNVEYIDPLIKAGAISKLDDYLKYAPELTNNFSDMINYSKEYSSSGKNELYALYARSKTEASPVATSRYGCFLSWQDYKAAGCPVITSIDDYLNLLKTIQSKRPTTDSGKKVYGISRFNDWGIGHMLSDPLIWKCFGQYSIKDDSTFNLSNLDYIDLYNKNHMYWATARMYFKANQMGLLDPETYTQKNEDYMQKINEGQIITSSMEWDWDSINANLAKNGGSDKYVDIPWADIPEFPEWVNRASEFGMSARTFVVSSKCDEKKLKGIMRFFNFVFSEDGARSIMDGPKGVTWDYDENGVAVFTKDCLQKITADPDYLAKQGANSYLGIIGQDYDAFAKSKANKGKYIDIKLNTDYVKANMTEADKEFTQQYGVEVPLEVLTNRKNQSTMHEGYLNLMPASDPTNISRAVTKIDDYLMQAVPDMVFSSTEDEFNTKYDAIQAQLKILGYDDVTKYCKDAWQKAIQNYKTLMKSN